jgi:hypothetical protein
MVFLAKNSHMKGPIDRLTKETRQNAWTGRVKDEKGHPYWELMPISTAEGGF